MGKSCIRFKKLDDLPLDLIGEAMRRTPAAAYIRQYEAARDGTARPGAKKKAPTRKKARAAKATRAGAGPVRKQVRRAPKRST